MVKNSKSERDFCSFKIVNQVFKVHEFNEACTPPSVIAIIFSFHILVWSLFRSFRPQFEPWTRATLLALDFWLSLRIMQHITYIYSYDIRYHATTCRCMQLQDNIWQLAVRRKNLCAIVTLPVIVIALWGKRSHEYPMQETSWKLGTTF